MTDRLLLAQISVDVRDLNKQMQRAGFVVDQTGRKMAQDWRRSTSSMGRDTEQFGRDVRRALSGIALATVATEITDLADTWTRAGNQISAASAATGRAGIALSSIADIARGTRTEFEATATLYARLTRATADLGASQAQVVEATRLINQAFVAGGASANEQASAVLQLSQALQSGVLQGDELKSLRESSPLLLAAIAKEFGVAQGALKALGAEGKLTSDRIFKAILSAAPEIEAQFSVTQSTVADSFTNLRTAAVEYVGTLDSSLGVTASLGGAVNALADNFEAFADALVISVALLGARGIGGALNSAAASAIQYVRSSKDRSNEVIAGYKRERDAALERARQAANDVEADKASLRSLGKERLRLQKIVEAGPKLFEQYGANVRAADELTAAERRLNDALTSRRPIEGEIAAATQSRNAAAERLAKLQAGNFANVNRLLEVDSKYAVTQQRLATNTNILSRAQSAAATSAKLLATASNQLSRAGAGVLSFFGGPIGVALIGVTAAIAYFQSETVKAERAVRNINSALGILAESYNVSQGQAYEAAAAAGKLTAELIQQKEAAEALAEIEKQERRETYIEGLEAARKRVKALREELSYLKGESVDFDNIVKYAGQNEEKIGAALSKIRKELSDTERYLGILERGFQALDAAGFATPEVSTEVSGTVTGDTDSDTESAVTARLNAEKRAAEEAKSLIEGIEDAWRGFYEWEDEAITRRRDNKIAAINAAALTEAQKIAAIKQANETADAERSALIAKEIEDAEEAAKAKADAAAQELELVDRVLNARDAALGRFLDISRREFEGRRKDILENVKDEENRAKALQALAEEEAEFRRQAADELRDLDERSDDGSKIAAIQETLALELQLLQEGFEAKLLLEEEYLELRRELIADSEAEIQEIRTASLQMQLAAAESLFNGLASLAATFAGRQSGIYKALFAVEKAAALASAYVAGQKAIALAAASAPPPLNGPAIIAAKVQSAATIAGILASTAAGFKSGGYTGDGDPNSVAGAVHRGEYVFDAKATKRLGKANLEALRSGRGPMTLAGPVAPARGRSVSFGDTILNVSGNGAAEIMDSLQAQLDAHRRGILRDVDRGMGSAITRETNRTTPRHERKTLK